MKSVKLFSLSAPLATCALYWFHTKSETNQLSHSLLHAAEKQMKLEQVQVVFRHGARTPLSFWTKEHFAGFSNIQPATWDKNVLLTVLPWTDIDYTVKLDDGSDPQDVQFDGYHGVEHMLKGGCYNGQLTNVGQQQLYDLGKSLAQEYIVNQKLISPSYEKNQLYVRSTYYRRTIQSAACLLAGLYGKETLTEPVHIETKRTSKEDLFANWSACANFVKWFRNAKQMLYTPQRQEVEDAMNTLLGKTEEGTPAFLIAINDLIHCRELHGFYVPQFLLDKREVIQKYAVEAMLVLLGSESMAIARNGIGSFLETLCCRINEAIEEPRACKMMLYAAHDWTLFSMFIALGVEVKEWPLPASHIIVELYKNEEEGKRYIRVVYNGKPLILDSETDEEYLPVEKFMDLVKDYRVVDFDEDCGNVL